MVVIFQRPHESDSPLKNFFYKIFGVPHVGTKIRGNAVFKLLTETRPLSILDIGCGSSYFSYELQKRGHTVTSLDSLTGITRKDVQKFATIFRKGGMKFNFVEGSATKLPFPKASFDAVLIIDVIEHIKDEDKVMEEIHRVLKPSGFFLASTPSLGFHSGKFKKFFRYIHQHTFLRKLSIWDEIQLYPKSHMESEGHFREYSGASWKRLCNKHGFSLESSEQEYKFFGAFFVELYHTFPFVDRYGNYLFFFFYPFVLLDTFIPLRGTGIAIRGRKR
jgi:ubiquinone/menaquinone biosynthesis C-methylase UbiE